MAACRVTTPREEARPRVQQMNSEVVPNAVASPLSADDLDDVAARPRAGHAARQRCAGRCARSRSAACRSRSGSSALAGRLGLRARTSSSASRTSRRPPRSRRRPASCSEAPKFVAHVGNSLRRVFVGFVVAAVLSVAARAPDRPLPAGGSGSPPAARGDPTDPRSRLDPDRDPAVRLGGEQHGVHHLHRGVLPGAAEHDSRRRGARPPARVRFA